MADRTPESGVPFLTKLKRQLPGFAGGKKADVRLPREHAEDRDPRLPAPGPLKSIQEGLEIVKSLGRMKK